MGIRSIGEFSIISCLFQIRKVKRIVISVLEAAVNKESDDSDWRIRFGAVIGLIGIARECPGGLGLYSRRLLFNRIEKETDAQVTEMLRKSKLKMMRSKNLSSREQALCSWYRTPKLFLDTSKCFAEVVRQLKHDLKFLKRYIELERKNNFLENHSHPKPKPKLADALSINQNWLARKKREKLVKPFENLKGYEFYAGDYHKYYIHDFLESKGVSPGPYLEQPEKYIETTQSSIKIPPLPSTLLGHTGLSLPKQKVARAGTFQSRVLYPKSKSNDLPLKSNTTLKHQVKKSFRSESALPIDDFIPSFISYKQPFL